MEPTVKSIQWAVTCLFHNHMYHLYNSYIYNWECDYFSRTKSGNDYEVEIKMSRGDFFADFKKDKHRIFTAAHSKQKYIVKNLGTAYGEVVGSYKIGLLANRSKRMYGNHYSQLEISESATHEDFLNGYKNFNLSERNIFIHARYSRIHIGEVEKLVIPNCFYYACPAGLIKPEETPTYAGLIYIEGAAATVVKKAPYMHKRGTDLNAILLSKFYYETVRHRNRARRNPELYKD